MSEFLKVIGVVLFMFFAVATAVVWTDNRPDNTTWILRMAYPIIAAVGLLLYLFIYIKSKHAIVPDFLARYSSSYFDCKGFCFTFFPSCENNIFMVNMIFQNRYERRSIAKIAIRPCDFWPFGKESPAIFHIECGPGSFGMANLPIALPAKYQGKKQKFDVGAEVSYPEGKGKMLRFRNAIMIRNNLHFRNNVMTMASILMATHLHFQWAIPPRFTIQLPNNVAEQITADSKQYTEIMWTLNEDHPTEFLIKGFSDQTKCSERT